MNFKDFYTLLNEWTEIRSPQLFDILKKAEHPLMGVHYTNGLMNEKYKGRFIPHLSPNPKPHHADPIGIYTFPKDYVLSGGLDKNRGFAKSRYVFVLQPSANAKILNLNLSEPQVRELLRQMGIPEELYDNPEIYHHSRKNKTLTPGHLLWGVMEHWRSQNNLSRNVSWNVLFRKTGYNVLYDPGLAIIHSNEPQQVVYLESKAYQVVDFMPNNITGFLFLFRKEFADFQMKRNSKNHGWGSEYAEYTFTKDENYFKVTIYSLNGEVSITVNGNDPIRMFSPWGDSPVFKDYTFDEAVAEIKKQLQLGPRHPYKDEPLENKWEYGIIKGIGEAYGIKPTIGKYSANIVREYTKKALPNYRLNVTIGAGLKEGGEKMMTIVINYRRLYYKSDTWDYDYYEYHYQPVDTDDPVSALNQLLDGFAQHLDTKAKESKDSADSYKASKALGDLKILRTKVFPPKPTRNKK